MDKFVKHTGVAVALNRANVDTDAIIPKQFLKSIKRTGFGVHLFDGWRYLDEGQPGVDCSKRPLNPEFELNRPEFKGGTVLVAGPNFGCGSSREHAPWALQQYGFKVIVAPSYADIFFNNCFKNGLLPIVLKEEEIKRIFAAIEKSPGLTMTVDLESQQVEIDSMRFSFDVEPFRKHCLMNGLDDIGLTLNHADEIKAFEAKRLASQPWLANTI
ncbi:3-isopropylmalate dehydratase small subunit [Limnobacter litoralis]|uniref:3-isopropylmalate dehydratase small subunit n=1 Tax=Limnobacter litoralis TaxID=481366 RepID=A0ABQ5YR42_9BURK|nr:3-isopropylmalate dehydratase small subunit [Limnobacter litoralis]GLR25830.1 3-isopropylmalate dehydratase small subunit [Limnobacter litoralis]